jgi:hypothetical protein
MGSMQPRLNFHNQINFPVINQDHPTQFDFPRLIREKNEMISSSRQVFVMTNDLLWDMKEVSQTIYPSKP